MNVNRIIQVHVVNWDSLLDSMSARMTAEELAKAVTRLFWHLDSKNTRLAGKVLSEISNKHGGDYYWIGGTAP